MKLAYFGKVDTTYYKCLSAKNTSTGIFEKTVNVSFVTTGSQKTESVGFPKKLFSGTKRNPDNELKNGIGKTKNALLHILKNGQMPIQIEFVKVGQLIVRRIRKNTELMLGNGLEKIGKLLFSILENAELQNGNCQIRSTTYGLRKLWNNSVFGFSSAYA